MLCSLQVICNRKHRDAVLFYIANINHNNFIGFHTLKADVPTTIYGNKFALLR